MDDTDKDWKLKLKYGKITTSYKHYTIIADGITDQVIEEFECLKGKAFMGMKIWAESIEQSAEVYQSISEQIGFAITGDLQIFGSEAEEPPGENPSGYDITFTPYQ